MDKELEPTIDDVEMALYTDGELVLLRGEQGHFTIDDVHKFDTGDPEYSIVRDGIIYCNYEAATVSIDSDGEHWEASAR